MWINASESSWEITCSMVELKIFILSPSSRLMADIDLDGDSESLNIGFKLDYNKLITWEISIAVN